MSTSRKRWTAAEMDALPVDRLRHEIIDGERCDTPPPSQRHQQAVLRLMMLLLPYCDLIRADLLFAPGAVKFSEFDQVQPDLFVLPRTDEGRLATQFADVGRLLLAVEVLSPSSSHMDRVTKRVLYRANGVPEYWVVDIETRMVERWTTVSEKAELVSDTLAWQPVAEHDAALAIDLATYFRSID